MQRECGGGVRAPDVPGTGQTGHVFLALASHRDGVLLSPLDDAGESAGEARVLRRAELAAEVSRLEFTTTGDRPRWVWDDTTT